MSIHRRYDTSIRAAMYMNTCTVTRARIAGRVRVRTTPSRVTGRVTVRVRVRTTPSRVRVTVGVRAICRALERIELAKHRGEACRVTFTYTENDPLTT
jgi:hypothetical protein